MIDPVWAGVVGTAVGAVAGGAASLLAPLINWRTEKQRLVAEKENAKDLADHQHAHEMQRVQRVAEAEELSAKRLLVADWREGVAHAIANYADAYHHLESDGAEASHYRHLHGTEMRFDPVAGTPWFETLRPHLDKNNLQIQAEFVVPTQVRIDEARAKTLSDEITRIAREWGIFS